MNKSIIKTISALSICTLLGCASDVSKQQKEYTGELYKPQWDERWM